jgi:hypothetical protein
MKWFVYVTCVYFWINLISLRWALNDRIRMINTAIRQLQRRSR